MILSKESRPLQCTNGLANYMNMKSEEEARSEVLIATLSTPLEVEELNDRDDR